MFRDSAWGWAWWPGGVSYWARTAPGNGLVRVYGCAECVAWQEPFVGSCRHVVNAHWLGVVGHRDNARHPTMRLPSRMMSSGATRSPRHSAASMTMRDTINVTP